MKNLTTARHTVIGTVTDANNRTLARLIVKAFDRDLRSESPLGESVTDGNGRYRIDYALVSFAEAEKKTADLSMKVFGPGNVQVYETDFDRIVFNASQFETIDITITAEVRPDINEFEFLLREIADLTAGIKTAQLEENDKNRDVSFLAREAGLPADKLEHLVVAHRLQDESQIDPAFFYALLRKNTLLKTKLDRTLRVRLSIDIHTEIKPLLFDIVLTDPEII